MSPSGVSTLTLSMLLYITSAEVLDNFIDIDKGIKGIQVEDYEIKIVKFADNILSPKFAEKYYLLQHGMQVIIKLGKMHLGRRMLFQKAMAYGMEHIKKELINQDKCNGQNFPLKYLELLLVTLSFRTNSNQDKISEGIIKKSISGTK